MSCRRRSGEAAHRRFPRFRVGYFGISHILLSHGHDYFRTRLTIGPRNAVSRRSMTIGSRVGESDSTRLTNEWDETTANQRVNFRVFEGMKSPIVLSSILFQRLKLVEVGRARWTRPRLFLVECANAEPARARLYTHASDRSVRLMREPRVQRIRWLPSRIGR